MCYFICCLKHVWNTSNENRRVQQHLDPPSGGSNDYRKFKESHSNGLNFKPLFLKNMEEKTSTAYSDSGIFENLVLCN